jgi:RNA-directed DNA polymerase
LSVRLNADDATLRASFAALRRFGDIARLLEVNWQTLGYYLKKSNNYKQFSIRKRSGGTRDIHAPITPLKIIQRKLAQVLQAVYQGRSPSHGFCGRKSIVTNARQHLNSDFVFNFDLENFFPTIHIGRVLGMFAGKPYSLPKPVSFFLARICCNEGKLPIGAPTSPVVSNMICAQMDAQLKELAVKSRCAYTRYADDLTFSSRHGRPPSHVALLGADSHVVVGPAVEAIVTANGFAVNPTKTRLLPRGYRQEVTGLVVNRRVNVKRTYVRHVRAILHACERWGLPAAEKEFRQKYDRKPRLARKVQFPKVLRGKIEFIGSVRGRDDFLYVSLLSRYLRLYPDAHSRRIIVGPNAQEAVVEKAVWVLEDQNFQGTAFACEGVGLITAAHVLSDSSLATCLPLAVRDADVVMLARDPQTDVAACLVKASVPIQFRAASTLNLKKGDPVKVLGFPLHNHGNKMSTYEGKITQFSVWHGVNHVMVDCPIIKGNSGGPILNAANEVIGIAVKGQGIPKQFASDDDLSRFVPIDVALKSLGY